MKGTTLDNILSILIFVALIVVIIQQCNTKPATMPGDNINTIIEKLQNSFDTIETEVLGTIQGDISILDSVLVDRINVLTEAQKELIERVKLSEAKYSKQNKELKQFLSIKTATADTFKQKIYVVDTNGVEVIVPEWFKALPWQLRATHVDNLDYVNVFYDLLSDSVTTEVLIHNEFDIETYEEAGQTFVKVNNLNPKTYTLPGSSSFNLDLPTQPAKYKPWRAGLQVGVGVTSDLKPRPYIGAGISYTPKINLKNIFRKKN